MTAAPGVRTLSPPVLALLALALATNATAGPKPVYELNDSHFHLTNYVQEGTDIHKFVEIMGDKVGRVALFGIPLQQMWSYENSGEYAPTYYLQSDAPLYYYSFTDAWIATAYKGLSRKDQARFDPMITGFNPADMYAADHIRRVLRTFPGVFSGIGEFTIHKEFVSAKLAGGEPSLANKALDRIFDLAAESGLVVLIHNDIDMPFAKEGVMPVYLEQMRDLLLRHRGTTVIWAHVGMGRVVHPVQSEASASAAERPPGQVGIVERMLGNPELDHLYFDISWNEVAKYIVATPETTRLAADIINRYPDRFLFGTDEVAPPDQATYLRVYRQYDPLWQLLTPEARQKVLKGNYERLFDAARLKVRKWEAANLK
jgi:predicted TIM-barrel fold metal-dependent hydrolase